MGRPVRPATNPDCVGTRHRTANAARKYHCTCAEALEELDEYRARQRERVRERRYAELDPTERRRRILALADPDPGDDPPEPWPDIPEYGWLWSQLVRDRRAACRDGDPDWWFSINPVERLHAKRICGTCPLTDSCLTVALQAGFTGVWGGTDEDQRAAIRAMWKRPA